MTAPAPGRPAGGASRTKESRPVYALTLIDVGDEGVVTDDPPLVPFMPYPGLKITHGHAVWKVLEVQVDDTAPPTGADTPWPVTALVHYVR